MIINMLIGIPFRGLFVGDRYGAELNTQSNAIADPNGTEVDTTTGWSESGLNGTGANVFESQGAVKAVGGYAFHMESNDTPTVNAGIYIDLQAVPFSFSDGEEGKIEVYGRHVGTGSNWQINLGSHSAGVDHLIKTWTVGETTFTKVTYTWTHAATYRYIVIRERNGDDNGGLYVDNLSIKKKV